MYAERVLLETDQLGNIKGSLKLPANKQFEAIFLVIDDVNQSSKRTPHPDIAGKVKILGEVFNSSPASDWNLLK